MPEGRLRHPYCLEYLRSLRRILRICHLPQGNKCGIPCINDDYPAGRLLREQKDANDVKTPGITKWKAGLPNAYEFL